MYARLFDVIEPALTAELAGRVLSSRSSTDRLCCSTLGVDAAVRGAAGAVVNRALKDPGAFTEWDASSDSSSPSRARRTG
jgi:hypothetical protein